MTENVIPFPHRNTPISSIAHFIRLGAYHRRMGDIHAAGFLPTRRLVVEASKMKSQKEVIATFRREGAEIVLDTGIAELASKLKFQGSVKNVPWLPEVFIDPLGPKAFNKSSELIDNIARFAVEHKVNTVLAPTHFLGDPRYSDWFDIDQASCAALRRALDKEGGPHIAIDYPIIHTHISLNDEKARNKIISGLRSLPIDNIWLRLSGLGKDAGPQKTRNLITSLYGLQSIDRPMILDYADGLIAHSALAFGAISGIAHGVAEMESFNARNWHNYPKEREDGSGFGRTTYIPVPGLGRSFNANELTVLASARGGKKHLSCQNGCCTHGISDMLKDSRQHAAFHSICSVEKLETVPDLNREGYFLGKPLRDAETLARNISKLKPSQTSAEQNKVNLESLQKRTEKHYNLVEKLAISLDRLHQERGDQGTRTRACGEQRSQVTQTRKGKK